MTTSTAGDGLVFRETERPLRVLVIDDEKSVRVLLETVLCAEGMQVDTTDSDHEARCLISRQGYDLLMIEESLPSRHGVALLRDLRASGVETPALIMTAYPTVEMLDSSFEAGASDFIKKPFAGIAHLVSRACLVAEQGSGDRFYQRLVGDLTSAARSKKPSAAVYKRALRSCKETRASLDRRPAAVIVDRDPASATGVGAILEEAGHLVELLSDPARALARITDPLGPLVLIIDLAVPGALSAVARARASNASPEIVIVGGPEHLHDALQGVDLGASDYCLRDERRQALARRVARAVERARKQVLKREVLDIVRRVTIELHGAGMGGSPGPAGVSKEEREKAAARARLSDKRLTESRRFATDLPAVITPDGEEAILGRVKDVSRTGMFVYTSDPHPRGSKVRVYVDATSIGLPKPLEAACLVQWNVRYDPDPAQTSGMGVSLLEDHTDRLTPLLEVLRVR